MELPMSTARVIVAGGCRCGKTELAKKFAGLHPGLTVRHTDDLQKLGWSEASEVATAWFDVQGPWLVEGVAASRSLRKWLRAHPEGKPCDLVFRLTKPFEDLLPGQASMNVGERTVWREIEPELRRRGVTIKEVKT